MKIPTEPVENAHGKYQIICSRHDRVSTSFPERVEKYADDNCLLFLWTNSADLPDAIDEGKAMGFSWATIAFVVDMGLQLEDGAPRENHDYTIPRCHFVLVMKKGKIPQPRGARNIRQYVSIAAHYSLEANLDEVESRIQEMFPAQWILKFARPFDILAVAA